MNLIPLKWDLSQRKKKKKANMPIIASIVIQGMPQGNKLEGVVLL